MSIARSDKAVAISEAHSLADIDGYGDEGAGYDYDRFAAELERRGWTWTGDDSRRVSSLPPDYMSNDDGPWTVSTTGPGESWRGSTT